MSNLDDVCLEYAFRIGCLQELISSQDSALSPGKQGNVSSESLKDRASSPTFDIGSLIGQDALKSPRYPEKFLKILDASLQRVAMGQDPRYSDQRFRRSIAILWSSNWADKSFQRQLKDSRKLEDLILAFVSASTRTLKKEKDLVDGGWKEQLDSQIVIFLDLLADNLGAVGSIAPDLRARLNLYRTSLQTSTSRKQLIRDHSIVPEERKNRMVDDETAVIVQSSTLVIREIFCLEETIFLKKRETLRAQCTIQAALDDLKILRHHLKTDEPVLYGSTDFADEEQWLSYMATESSALSDAIGEIMTIIPHDDKSTSPPNILPPFDGLQVSDPRAFVFIPPDPQETYRRLLRRCLDHDLQLLKNLPEDEDVSLGILSPRNLSLLAECALRWRLPSFFRAWVFLEAIQEHYEQGEVPPECVFDATASINRIFQEIPLSSWAIRDRNSLHRVLLRRNVYFLSDVEAALDFPGGYLSSEFRLAVENWLNLNVDNEDTSALRRSQLLISDRIRQQAYANYIDEACEKYTHEGGKNNRFAIVLATWIEAGVKRLDKWFPQPVTSQIDVVPLVLRQHLSLWIRDLEEVMTASSWQNGSASEQDLDESLDIYRRAQKLQQIGYAFGMHREEFPLSTIFEPIVSAWLDHITTKIKQWADNALHLDDFSPLSPNGHSSSVTDLFDSLQSAVSFLLELNWGDAEQLATFVTRLAKIISLCVDEYCSQMERLFSDDMLENDSHQSSLQQKAWIEKAKSTLAHLQSDKRIPAYFNFTQSSCVKLNNIDSARQHLDRLYEEMRVDEMASIDRKISLTPRIDHSFLFTVKIVLGESLSLNNSSRAPDSFVVLSDEHGNRYAKTRTIYDDYDPRWDESFDIALQGTAWFMVSVRQRNLAGKHDLLGRTYLRLDPLQYADCISKDVLLPLNTKGQILLRISMEGERDDIMFHFGRAFRWLKRTESDMVRMFVDKMIPVLRQTLSRNAIKAVLKGTSNSLDYNDALRLSNDAIVRISAAYRNALGGGDPTDYAIPLPPSEVVSSKLSPLKRGPTDAEIEAAIHPLFDYFDTNNHTLASNLSPNAMQMVMAKLWKQILSTIEGLIAPPLSDQPSSMKALTDSELDVALRWLKFLRDYFYAGGEGNGVSLATLQNAKFNEIMSVRIYYDWKTDDLMEECIRGFQNTLRGKAMKPSKSLVGQRNLGTIKARKSAKRSLPKGGEHTEMIMKILRMREGTQDFLAQQIQILNAVELGESTKSQGS